MGGGFKTLKFPCFLKPPFSEILAPHQVFEATRILKPPPIKFEAPPSDSEATRSLKPPHHQILKPPEV